MTEEKIMEEIEKMNKDPPENIIAGPINGDIFHWKATIKGPKFTDYEDGNFILDIQLPKDYPYNRPSCKFKTKIFHPNIGQDGRICLNILYKWNPNDTISNLLLSIFVLLAKPNFNSPLNIEASELFRKSEKEYRERVIKWVKDYSGLENIN